jgi:hypothetical protein
MESKSKLSIKARKGRRNLKNMNVMNKTMITESSHRSGLNDEDVEHQLN